MDIKKYKIITGIFIGGSVLLGVFLAVSSNKGKSLNEDAVAIVQQEEDAETTLVAQEAEQSEVVEETETDNEPVKNEAYLNDQIEKLQQENDYLRTDIEEYEKYESMYGEADARQLADAKLVSCYEENVVLALEIKALIMESLGVDVPIDFETNSTALDSYTEYFKDETVGKLASELGVDDVDAYLEKGMSTIDEIYEDGDDFQDILNNAKEVAVNGVMSSVENWCLSTAEQALDETTGGLYSTLKGINEAGSLEVYLENAADEKTGGLIGSIKGIANYESSTGELLNGISDNANSSAKQISEFLNKDTITSRDIRTMMYQYKQFGECMDTLGQYGVSVNYSWDKNYEQIEFLYERFLYNEVMMELLNKEGADQ